MTGDILTLYLLGGALAGGMLGFTLGFITGRHS